MKSIETITINTKTHIDWRWGADDDFIRYEPNQQLTLLQERIHFCKGWAKDCLREPFILIGLGFFAVLFIKASLY